MGDALSFERIDINSTKIKLVRSVNTIFESIAVETQVQ